MACAPVQVAPTVTVNQNLLTSRLWNVAVFDLNYEFEDEGTVSISKYKSAGTNGDGI